MAPKLTKEIRDAVQQNAGKPLDVMAEGDPSNQVYVVMTQDEFRRLLYDDTELTVDEMLAAAAKGADDPQGWGASELDAYDEQDDSPRVDA